MLIDLVGIIALTVAFQLFFIAFFLFIHYRKTRGSNIFLGFCFLILGVNMLDIFVQIAQTPSVPLFWQLFDDTLLLLLGPLLLFFTKSLVNKNFKIGLTTAFHAIPFLFIILLLIWLFNMSAPIGVSTLEAQEGTLANIVRGVVSLFYLHALIYVLSAKKILRNYDLLLKDYYSNPGIEKVRSIHLVLNTFLLLGVMGAVQLLLPDGLNSPYVIVIGLVLVLVLFVFVYRSIYQALKGSGWIKELLLEDSSKYSASTLEDNQRISLAKRLTTEMVENKLFLEPDLTIGQIANRLQISVKELSQVINQTFDQHFFDYVNTYRIEEALKFLKDPYNAMTIQEIMYAVGFSSKSSFNTIFKKKTGRTPSDFRQAALKRSD